MDLLKKTDSNESKIYTEDKTLQEMFLKNTGRLNRLRYFKRSLVMILVTFVIDFILITIFSDEWGIPTSFGNLATSVVGIVALVPMYCLNVRRLQDLNKDDTIAKIILAVCFGALFIPDEDYYSLSTLVIIVCLVETIIVLYLLFAPGTKGENKYGPDPLG